MRNDEDWYSPYSPYSSHHARQTGSRSRLDKDMEEERFDDWDVSASDEWSTRPAMHSTKYEYYHQ